MYEFEQLRCPSVAIPVGTHLREALPAALAPSMAIDYAQLAAIAIGRTRMPMVVSDAQAGDHPLVLANQAFLDQTGYAADEVIGRNCRFLQGPDTDPAAVAQICAAIAAGDGLTIELLNYRRDGRPFWNQLMLSPIVDDGGKLLYYFASQLDISDERRARDLAAREHVLLREIDHRAKNALALVQGIVRLTRADNAGDYSRSVQGRVEALAQAHILLSDAQWREVPLDRVVAVAAAPFRRGPTLPAGPDIAIAAAHVQPLILALHELLSNAAQHGALSADRGEATVRWQTDGDTIVLEVAESGGPPAEETATRGYGLTMVDAFVRRQLGGSIERHWHRRGLTTRVAFPRVPAARRAAR